MRYILFPFILFLANVSNGQTVNFKLTGNLINKTNSKTIYIVFGDTIDSIKIQKDNSFSYNGSTKNPALAILNTENSYVCNFWINSGEINIQLEDSITPQTKSTGKVYMNINKIQNLENYGKLWKIVENCGKLWQIVANCGKLWQIVANCTNIKK